MTGMDHVMGTRLAHVARGAGLVTAFSVLFFCAAPLGAQPSSLAPEAAPVAAAPPEMAPVSPPEAMPVTDAAPAAEGAAPPAEAAPRATNAVLPSTLPRDLSPWGMFLSAVLPVKIVMVGLALASLATWTVWLAKTIELWMARAQARRNFENSRPCHESSRGGKGVRPRDVSHRPFCRRRRGRGWPVRGSCH